MNSRLPGAEGAVNEVERLEVLFMNSRLPGGEVPEDEVD